MWEETEELSPEASVHSMESLIQTLNLTPQEERHPDIRKQVKLLSQITKLQSVKDNGKSHAKKAMARKESKKPFNSTLNELRDSRAAASEEKAPSLTKTQQAKLRSKSADIAKILAEIDRFRNNMSSATARPADISTVGVNLLARPLDSGLREKLPSPVPENSPEKAVPKKASPPPQEAPPQRPLSPMPKSKPMTLNTNAVVFEPARAAVDAKVAKEVEILTNESVEKMRSAAIKSFGRPRLKGAMAKATLLFGLVCGRNLEVTPNSPLLCVCPSLQAVKDMAIAINTFPHDSLNYMVRAALYHELGQVC
jgi:hypothetical protein